MTDALVPIEHGRFTITTNGLQCNGVPTYEEWEEIGHVLAVMVRGIQFCVGDWLRIGEQFGELAAQVIDARSWSDATVRVYKSIAERVPLQVRRMDDLTFAHHMAVAALPPREQKRWLDRAAGNGDGESWTVNRLTQAVKAGHDRPATSWHVLATCASAREQAKIAKLLEREGVTVRTFEGRKPRGRIGV